MRGIGKRRGSDPSEDGDSGRPTAAEIDRQLTSWPPRRIASWSLMIAAGVVVVQHLIAHAGVQPLPLSMGWQDILVGYPTAALLGLIGAVLVDPRPRI